jgi:hypothetical protein
VRAFIDFVEGIVLSLRGSSAGSQRNAGGSRRSTEGR